MLQDSLLERHIHFESIVDKTALVVSESLFIKLYQPRMIQHVMDIRSVLLVFDQAKLDEIDTVFCTGPKGLFLELGRLPKNRRV